MPYEIRNNNYNPYGYEPIQRPMIPANGMMMQAPIPDTPLAIGDVVNAIREVQRNPSGFSMDEINRARELSMQYLGKDIEFANDLGRTVANTLFDAVDTLAFGLIPDSVGEKFGAKKLSSADEIGSMIGSTAALFTPGVGPMAVGTKIAEKFLPSVAKIGTEAVSTVSKVAGDAEKATTLMGKVGELAKGSGIASEGLAGVSKFLNSPTTAARIGSAIGGGFNFEDGINPTGAVLGAMFPMGAGKTASVKPIPKTGSVSSQMDEAMNVANMVKSDDTFIAMANSNPVFKDIMNITSKRGGISVTDATILAEKHGVSLKEIQEAESFFKKWQSKPRITEVQPVGTQGIYAAAPIDETLKAEVSKVMKANELPLVAKSLSLDTPVKNLTQEQIAILETYLKTKAKNPDMVYGIIKGFQNSNPGSSVQDLLNIFVRA